jgi:transposase
MKTRERELARSLRIDQGRSLKEIASELAVSTSSVSGWVRDVELSPEQHQALREHNRGGHLA